MSKSNPPALPIGGGTRVTMIILVFYAPVGRDDLLVLRRHIDGWNEASRLRPIFLGYIDDCLRSCVRATLDGRLERIVTSGFIEHDVVKEFDSRKDALIEFASSLPTLSLTTSTAL